MEKKKFRISTSYFTLLAISIFAYGCSASDPEPENEEELITTVNVTFTNSLDANDIVVASFEDIDGPGGDDGIATHPTLSANTTYNVTVEFLNESVTPTDDITVEVEEEGDEHQVFFVTSSGLNFEHAYLDEDTNGNPIGLNNTVVIGGESTGTMEVVLVHQPNKSNSGVSDGDITNAGGDEDVHVSFDVIIQ